MAKIIFTINNISMLSLNIFRHSLVTLLMQQGCVNLWVNATWLLLITELCRDTKMSEALITESEPLTFTLPDGSLKLVRKGTTLQNVAESIDSSVAKKRRVC